MRKSYIKKTTFLSEKWTGNIFNMALLCINKLKKLIKIKC